MQAFTLHILIRCPIDETTGRLSYRPHDLAAPQLTTGAFPTTSEALSAFDPKGHRGLAGETLSSVGRDSR